MKRSDDLNAHTIAEFRAYRGKVGGPFAGAPLLLLHSLGARSGTDRTLDVHASELHGEERDLRFRDQATLYPGFAGYQDKTRRVIPVVALIPMPTATSDVRG
jgi:hypothetical protein